MKLSVLFWTGALALSTSVQAASVATSSLQATAAARKVLEQGGNAADAACAAVFVLNVTQPYFTGIGSGGFALISRGDETRFLDFRERAPEAVNEKHFYKDGKPEKSWDSRSTGGWSVGVPGVVGGCGEIIQKYGSRSWKQTFQPALDLAIGGYAVTAMWASELQDQFSRLLPNAQAFFGGKSGKGLQGGEKLYQPELAQTFEKLASQGPDSFYRGELAREWLEEAKSIPGANVLISQRDLENFQVRHPEPIRTSFGSYDLETASLPSSSGLMVAATLRFLDWYHGRNGLPGAHSAHRYILELEASAFYAKIRGEKLADPSRAILNPQDYLGSAQESADWLTLEKKVQDRLAKIEANRLRSFDPCSVQHAPAKHTAQISIVDDKGMVVSMTTSLGDIFGSGILLPKHGFLLNSQLGDFDEKSGLPNSPAPGMSPRSNMSPLILYRKGTRTPLAAIGAAGGPYIPTAIVQFIQNYYVYGMKPQDALSYEKSPRAHTSDGGKSVELEKTASPILLARLRRAGYCISKPVDYVWAVVEAAMRQSDLTPWQAVHEPRYDGDSWTDGK